MLKGRKAPTTVPSLCACHKGPVRPRLEISKDQYEVFTKWNIAMHQDSALLRPLEQTYMESCLLQLSPWRQNAVVWHHTLNSRDEVSWHLSSQIKHLHSLFSVVPNHLGHLSIKLGHGYFLLKYLIDTWSWGIIQLAAWEECFFF